MPQPPPVDTNRSVGDEPAILASVEAMPLYREEVVVTRRRVPTQVVRAVRTTQSHDHRVEETLSHEHVVVERVPIGQVVQAVPLPREEGDIMILPVVEERLVMQRQLFLKEEVRIRRVKVSEQHVEVVTLREQVAKVTRSKLAADLAANDGVSASFNQTD